MGLRLRGGTPVTQELTQNLTQESLTSLMQERNRWLEDQIRQLSVAALERGTFTCTACGEADGEYILDRNGDETCRLSAVETYAFLQFVLKVES